MEHYCSLQISQLLVKLGFKQKTKSIYTQFNVWKNGKVCKMWSYYGCEISLHAKKGEFPRPTHAEAIEWLRKYKKVYITAQIFETNPRVIYSAKIVYFENGYDDIYLHNRTMCYQTPFKATEAALKFVLRNLLKN